MKCVLVGNYGVANLGDEALRTYFLHTYPDIQWMTLSANPSTPLEYPRLPGGIRSLLGTPWWKTIRAIRSCDAMVFGGGSLFTDVESRYACFLWWMHAAVARFFGKPVFLAFQGMGPYKTGMGEACARWAARHAGFISVRDPASAERLKKWGLHTKIVQTFDPIFSLMKDKKYPRNTQNVFTIIPRHNSGEQLQSAALELISTTSDIHTVHILLMQPDSKQEQGIAESIHTSMPIPSTIIPVRTLDSLMEEVCASSSIVTQRFHGALAALAAGVPTKIISQGEGDKLSQLTRFTEGANVQELVQLVEKGEQELRQAFDTLARTAEGRGVESR